MTKDLQRKTPGCGKRVAVGRPGGEAFMGEVFFFFLVQSYSLGHIIFQLIFQFYNGAQKQCASRSHTSNFDLFLGSLVKLLVSHAVMRVDSWYIYNHPTLTEPF